jgi:hypothetical protein
VRKKSVKLTKLLGLGLLLGLTSAGRAIAAEPPVVTIEDMRIDVAALVADTSPSAPMALFHSRDFTSVLNKDGALFVHQYFVAILDSKTMVVSFRQIDCEFGQQRNLITTTLLVGQNVRDTQPDLTPGDWRDFPADSVASQSCSQAYNDRAIDYRGRW